MCYEVQDVCVSPPVPLQAPPTPEPSLILHARRVKRSSKSTTTLLRGVAVSLARLLDYVDADASDGPFELSLLAEGFNEMLMAQYGTRIYDALLKAEVTRWVGGCRNGCYRHASALVHQAVGTCGSCR